MRKNLACERLLTGVGGFAKDEGGEMLEFASGQRLLSAFTVVSGVAAP
jgi:hypothetical protein